MSDNTKIEWTDSSWSPWRDCTKVSPRVLAKNWQEPVRWNKRAERDGTRHKVFPSLCDWLDDEVPAEWLARFIGLIAATPNLDWLLLTKRPELWRERIAQVTAYNAAKPWTFGDAAVRGMANDWIYNGRTPENVWLGVSVEDQTRADERIPALIETPAKIRFLSVEPLLGPVDLGYWLEESLTPQLDWVIVGGESGPKARPCNVEWVRDIVCQCRRSGVPCFVKQIGAKPEVEAPSGGWMQPVPVRHPKGGDPAERPEDLRVRFLRQ